MQYSYSRRAELPGGYYFFRSVPVRLHLANAIRKKAEAAMQRLQYRSVFPSRGISLRLDLRQDMELLPMAMHANSLFAFKRSNQQQQLMERFGDDSPKFFMNRMRLIKPVD